MKASIVIRTLNEAKHLPKLLQSIKDQDHPADQTEVVLVDSGSTDGTLDIAERFGVRIVKIRKEDFSFGRSLNVGCDAATGEVLVFISGHCIPEDTSWLRRLIAPLGTQDIAYSYGGQIGDESSRFSERQIFAKYFPGSDKLPQEGFFCNNANSALLRSVWSEHQFDEELTGLEDMQLAKRLVAMGYKIGYVAAARVYHLHSESWAQVRRRFEREAIALQQIMPEVHISMADVMRYFTSAVLLDLGAALQERKFRSVVRGIVAYRFMQFTGSYRGNHFHRLLSKRRKEAYFFPR